MIHSFQFRTITTEEKIVYDIARSKDGYPCKRHYGVSHSIHLSISRSNHRRLCRGKGERQEIQESSPPESQCTLAPISETKILPSPNRLVKHDSILIYICNSLKDTFLQVIDTNKGKNN